MKKISLFLALIMLLSCVMFACETETNDEKNDNESSINSEETSLEVSSEETSSEVEKSESYKEAMSLIEQAKYEEAYTLLYSVHKTDKDCADLMNDFKVVYVSHTAKGEGICGDYDYIQTTVYAYDSVGNLSQKVSSLNSMYENTTVTELFTTFYTYDDGKLIKEEIIRNTGISSIIEYVYNSDGVLTKKIGTSNESNVSTTEYSYDSNGRISKEVYNITVGEKYNRTESKEYTYDTDGRLLKITDKTESGDIVTEYTYNSDGKILKEVCNYYYGVETVTDYVYDEDGMLLKKLCPNGDYVSVEYTYDSNGNLIKEVSVHAEGITETIEYAVYLYFYCPQE